MPKKRRRKYRVCQSCHTRFTGRYCPFCGAEGGKKRLFRSGGFIAGLLRFLLALILLALIFCAALIALDYFASTDGGAHTTAEAILNSVKNALPQSWLDVYASAKQRWLDPLFALLP